MQLVTKFITIQEIESLAKERFGDMIKAVVDIEQEIMVVDAELHADQEAFLLKNGSKQQHLWGINLYPELFENPDWIEFDSMINLRPSRGNTSREVDDSKIQDKIVTIVNQLVT